MRVCQLKTQRAADKTEMGWLGTWGKKQGHEEQFQGAEKGQGSDRQLHTIHESHCYD